MRRFPLAMLVGLAGLATSIPVALAQTSVASDPVGFTTGSELSNSDTLVSIPFTLAPEFTGAISSISGNVITVSGTPGWTTNQFVYAAGTQPNHYYVLIGPSPTGDSKEGHAYAVTANDATTLTANTTSDDLSGTSTSAQLLIIPNWTLNTIYPSTDQNVSFTPTAATRAFKSEILIPNYAATGVNQAFSTVYFFSNNVNGTTGNVGWRVVGDNTTDHGDDPLLPAGYFVVRNLNGAPTLPLTAMGNILTKKFAIPLMTQPSQPQDNSVAMIRPVDVTLNNTGLNPTDGSFVATTATRNFQDELLLFNNTATALNKSPSAVYFYSNNVNGSTNNVGWRMVGDNTTDHGNDVIPAGSAMIVRKASTVSGATAFWTNAPTY